MASKTSTVIVSIDIHINKLILQNDTLESKNHALFPFLMATNIYTLKQLLVQQHLVQQLWYVIVYAMLQIQTTAQ